VLFFFCICPYVEEIRGRAREKATVDDEERMG